MTSPARIVALVAVLVALGPGVLAHAQQAQAPRLVVVLVIDQMRSDYIDRYKHQWNAGGPYSVKRRPGRLPGVGVVIQQRAIHVQHQCFAVF